MNILFIVIDTLRATRLGCYGYPLPTSPAIDALAANGALLETCIAPGIPTTPAHATMFTGLHPVAHNIVCHGGAVDLDRSIPVLPELLQRSGYTTAAVDNLFDIKPWLARGYEFYINPSFRHRLRLLVSCEEVNARAIEWLTHHGSERFFLFLHYWEPHTPYLPPARFRTFYPAGRDPFSPVHTSFEPIKRQPFWDMFGDVWFSKLGPVTDADYIASLYDAEIRHVDDAIAEIISTLEALGLANDTLVVLTGDHGESLGQHDIFFDHHGLYEDVIRVPLMFRLPGRIAPDTRLAAMAQHLDLAPTILEAANIQSRPVMDGRSLWPLLTGQSEEGGHAEALCCENTWQSKYALRTPSRKLILSRAPDRHNMPTRELYDLIDDPDETHNLAAGRPQTADEMERRLEELLFETLTAHGRTADPLTSQPITLGKRWDKRS